MSTDKKMHWETVYSTKTPDQFSWTQQVPATSLDFIHAFNPKKDDSIIDVGGGDSKLVDFLLEEGFENITVLDISETALANARKRLGKKAEKVKWIASDITAFKPAEKYTIWHDRATFHFLTSEPQIHSYLQVAKEAVTGFMAIGTFSDRGPKKCSGIDIKQYTEPELQARLSDGFRKIRCITEDHITPFNTRQNFLFCSFRRV